MANGSIITSDGKKTFIYRAYTANADLLSTQYLPMTKYELGISNGTPSTADTGLAIPIPISNGTVLDDGSNTFDVGSTTDNTSIYKEGAGETDATAQNLIDASGTGSTSVWSITDLSVAGAIAVVTKYAGHWFYIKDSTTLAKITSVRTELGDNVTNYYYFDTLNADLIVGWNWLVGDGLMSTWTRTASPVVSDIDYFTIRVTKNATSDTFASGDLVYDLLRQWEDSDLTASIDAAFPEFDLTNFQVTNRITVSTIQANGFSLNGLGMKNEDSDPLLLGEDTFAADSKDSTDEFVFIVKDRVI